MGLANLMTLNSIEDQHNEEDLTQRQQDFVDFLEGASTQTKESEKPKLNKIWNILIYGSFGAIGIFLVYLYSSFIFINK